MTLICRNEHQEFDFKDNGPVVQPEDEKMFPTFVHKHFCTCSHCHSTFIYKEEELKTGEDMKK